MLGKFITDVDAVIPGPISKKAWTAVIPAAGLGSRLGYGRPKILFPVGGKRIVDWLLDKLEPFVSNYVFVLSPAGSAEVEPYLRNRLGCNYKIAIQSTPTGMGDAVLAAEPFVKTQNTLVVWGDQLTLSDTTLAACIRLHEHRRNPTLTLPTIMRAQPYTDCWRDRQGRIIQVKQARESEALRAVGENDCGLFLFGTQMLFQTLRQAREDHVGFGRQTKEFNLLQLLPLFEREPGSVCTVRIHNLAETIGVNTWQEARQLSL